MSVKEELGVVIRALEREVVYWKNAHEVEQRRVAIAIKDLENTSRDYSELRESYDKLFDEYARLKESKGFIPELREALLKLANEASGFLALSDIERHGQTNSRILRDRISKARDVLMESR